MSLKHWHDDQSNEHNIIDNEEITSQEMHWGITQLSNIFLQKPVPEEHIQPIIDWLERLTQQLYDVKRIMDQWRKDHHQ